MKNFCLILFFTCLSLVAFSDNADKGKTATRSVSGKVIDSTGEALAGTKITVKETGEVFFSNLDGNFNFTLKTDKVYSLSIETIGYQPKEINSSDLTYFSELSLTSL